MDTVSWLSAKEKKATNLTRQEKVGFFPANLVVVKTFNIMILFNSDLSCKSQKSLKELS